MLPCGFRLQVIVFVCVASRPRLGETEHHRATVYSGTKWLNSWWTGDKTYQATRSQ